ncbi:hypothetical protein D3C86_2193190 [compost metagenome]
MESLKWRMEKNLNRDLMLKIISHIVNIKLPFGGNSSRKRVFNMLQPGAELIVYNGNDVEAYFIG